MRYLVTGATGLLGNNVVRQLLARGDAVRVLVRRADDRSLAGLPVETALGDITKPETLAPAMRDRDVVIHSAGYVHIGWTGMDEARKMNVEGTRSVARAAREAKLRMVHVSSVDALGLGDRAHPANEETPPEGTGVLCPYVITKREGEQALLEEVNAGLDATIVNPAFMLGPWDWKPSSGRMILELAGGWAKLAPRGGNDFCDVRDVASGILAAVEKGKTGRRYILGGEPLSILEAWIKIANIIGVEPPWRHWRWPMYYGCKAWGNVMTKITGREPNLNGAAIEIGELEHHFDDSRARTELGYTTRPATEAFQAAWDWFNEYGYVTKK